MITLKGKVVAERGMDYWRRRIEGTAHVRHRVELFILDRDVFRRVLGRGAAGRDHGRDRFSLPAYAIDRDGALWRGLETLQMGEYPNPRRDHLRELLPGNDRDDARHLSRRRGLYAGYSRMRVRRTQEHHMCHARQFHVADIEATPLHQSIEIR